jgi:hypothetical protein
MKKQTWIIIPSLAFLALSGCATLPTGPSVMVLPGTGKSFEQFQAEDAACRGWAGQSVGITPQQAVNQNTASGAVVGTAMGAAVGALIGAAAGNPGAGAAIGAGSGLLMGTASGANAANLSAWEAQRLYDNTYVQCMYAKGNQVPGTKSYHRMRTTTPPPPPGFISVPPDYAP